jgi:hypothetical protein
MKNISIQRGLFISLNLFNPMEVYMGDTVSNFNVICLDDHRRKRLGPSHLRVVKCDFLKPATQAETAQKPGQTDEAIDRARRAMYANAGVTLIGARMTAARWQGGDWE